ncbi:hypothetical protein [Lachnoclostridium phytofermentans]|uniref:hypothetical protein n=1 Tax=Lachnoclostridium phytofermentans TaxID=66219 RepID=UPI0002D60BBC|nr:hypothetical protein [Lachnoclostridium phytofermentans]
MQKKYQLIMLDIVVPIILRNRKHSPDRCVRNLMEFGEKISPHKHAQKEVIYEGLMKLCKGEEQQPILDYFFNIYL